MQRHPVDVDMLAQHVAGGTGYVGDDCRFTASQAFSRLDFPALGDQQ